jgi:hypothetical protein
MCDEWPGVDARATADLIETSQLPFIIFNDKHIFSHMEVDYTSETAMQNLSLS